MEGANTDGLALLGWILLLFLMIWFFAYILFAFLLNRLNKMVYGKKTILAWIPFVNNYVLGKITVNKVFGWVLLILSFFNNVIIYNVILGPLLLLGFIFRNGIYNNIFTAITYFWGNIFKLPEIATAIIINVDNLLLLVALVLGTIKYHKLSKVKKTEQLKNSQSVNVTGNIIDEKNNIGSIANDNEKIEKL